MRVELDDFGVVWLKMRWRKTLAERIVPKLCVPDRTEVLLLLFQSSRGLMRRCEGCESIREGFWCGPVLLVACSSYE